MPEVTNVEISPKLKAPGAAPILNYKDGKAVSKKDKTPVLMQNDRGQSFFAPEWLAAELESENKAVRLTASDHDYIERLRQAIGHVNGHKPGDVIQVAGRTMRAEEIGIFDFKALIEAAEKEVEALGSGEDSGGIKVVSDVPPGMKSFASRMKKKKFGR